MLLFKKYLSSFLLLALLLSIGWGFSRYSSAKAASLIPPASATAYQLVDAVNSLRTQHGLPAYSVNSILMSVAQAHSDYQASIGTVTHYGPGGSRPFQRALAAGYPVGGDLSAGGLYSENIQAGSGLTAQDVVKAWMGDAPHQETMLSASFIEVGAGVSCAGDYCYFTLDAADPSGSSVSYTPAPGSTSIAGGTPVPTYVVITPNTPAEDGSIKYTVRNGDTLYSIALAYKISVDDLKQLNRLSSDIIYVGNVLTIRGPSPRSTATVTATNTALPTYTPFVFWTVTPSITPTATPIPSAPVTGSGGMIVVGAIVVAALVLAGVLTASGARKRAK